MVIDEYPSPSQLFRLYLFMYGVYYLATTLNMSSLSSLVLPLPLSCPSGTHPIGVWFQSGVHREMEPQFHP